MMRNRVSLLFAVGVALVISTLAVDAFAKNAPAIRRVELQANTVDGKFGKYPASGSITLKQDRSGGAPYMTVNLVNMQCADRPNRFYALYAIVGTSQPIRLRTFNPSCITWMYKDTYSRSNRYYFHDGWFKNPITFEIWLEEDDGFDEVGGDDRMNGKLFMFGSD